ncbi:hypothetical protein ABZ299_15085 [Streptomyces sp. NPDC006184]|uniref:hypothetical protein n=1 Tax=unclassified Streptomyces TaxID=2593676 RepID=UPI0033AD4FAE
MDLFGPVLSLTAGNAGRSGLLSHINGLRFIRSEVFDADAAVTSTELLRFGHFWAAVHATRPSPAHSTGRSKAYAGTGVQAVHPRQ